MLKKWLNKLKGFFVKPPPSPSPIPLSPDGLPRSQPKVKIGDKVGNVEIRAQYQLDKHTDFRPGESYRVGQAIVTVHKDKASMLAAIAAVDRKREEKWAKAKERAIDIMMMTPEQLKALKINEWLAKRRKVDDKIKGIMGGSGEGNKYVSKRYIAPKQSQPSGIKDERTKAVFQELTKSVEARLAKDTIKNFDEIDELIKEGEKVK